MMQAEQYVYARVSKGLSGSGGYQTAAVSANLKNKSTILQNLQALSFQFQDLQIRETLLKWIAEAIAEQNPRASDMLAWTRQNHLIRELALTGRRLPLDKAFYLADTLSDEKDYDNSLHRFTAQKVFEEFSSFYDNETILGQILSPANIQRGGVSAGLLAVLAELQHRQTVSDAFDWERISSQDYGAFANNLIFLFNRGLSL